MILASVSRTLQPSVLQAVKKSADQGPADDHMVSKCCRPSNGSSLNSELLHGTVLINTSFVSCRTGSIWLPFVFMSYA